LAFTALQKTLFAQMRWYGAEAGTASRFPVPFSAIYIYSGYNEAQ